MRYLNLQNTVLISLLVAGVAATTGCSSGTDAPNSPAGAGGATSTGAAGSTGTAGQSSGASGSTTTTMAGAGGASGVGGDGTGGSGGSVNNGPPSICDGKGTRVVMLADAKVDNFEGDAISPGWSSFNDVMPTQNSFKIAQEAGGALATGHAGHYMGTGAKTTKNGGYGVGTVYNVAIDTKAGIYCIDISAFDGVTFWAKAAKDMSKVNVNFVLPETNKADAVNGGGDCPMASTTCFNHPYKAVTLTTAWAQYSVAFADAGMGMLPDGGAAKVKNRIQELVWITLDPDWDFSLDEIQFYKGTPPTTPVAM